MTRRIAYLRRARQDLLEIRAYIRRDSPSEAGLWLERVDRALGRLGAFPRSGVIPRDRRLAALGYRMVVIGDYLAFYVIRRDVVQVRRVLHGKRRYSFLFGK